MLLEVNFGSCFWKDNFGMECPGCGFQRAFNLLLEGKFWESIQMYPALIPMLLLVVFLILHLIFRFRFGARALLYSSLGITAVIFASYIVKQVIFFQQ